ncbi:hypothetical protein PVK06_048443 [Gossypium arboreum]|uniref:Uncharacterized protein n=1 Tax=Gossypium arboreum TaxID=29729 RepID=A0ABR0MFW5_GOSAR|nr:hypothetical protein PVK06_048443 [Gossypium arboreum]
MEVVQNILNEIWKGNGKTRFKKKQWEVEPKPSTGRIWDDGDKIKAVDTELDQSLKNMLPTKGSRARPEDERDVDQRNGVGKNRFTRDLLFYCQLQPSRVQEISSSARLQQLGSTVKAADKLASLFISASKLAKSRPSNSINLIFQQKGIVEIRQRRHC